ncbi:MAG TPA: AIR synthase-related protein, partial [Methylovirgula sp.]
APGKTLAEALLVPTRLYVRSLLEAFRQTEAIKALAHITGGGFPDNIPRVLPAGLGVVLDLAAIPVPAVFGWLAGLGNVAEAEMLRTFNCGIGMIVVAGASDAGEVEAVLRAAGESPVVIGKVVEASDSRVTYTGRLSL